MMRDQEFDSFAEAVEREAAEQEARRKDAKPNGSAEQALPILAKSDFIKDFVPPDYLIDGMLQRRFIYSLTGQTGHAKTAVGLLLAQLVGSTAGAMLARHQVEHGQVAYFVGENPDDVRMRVIGADSRRHDDASSDKIFFIAGAFDIGAMFDALDAKLRKNGPLDLVIVDTSARIFSATRN